MRKGDREGGGGCLELATSELKNSKRPNLLVLDNAEELKYDSGHEERTYMKREACCEGPLFRGGKVIAWVNLGLWGTPVKEQSRAH
jgi:hypothetical protein